MSEQAYLVAKAEKWKNISHYQDKRAQGRRTSRNGVTAASLGAGTAGTMYGLTRQYPKQLGSFNRVARSTLAQDDRSFLDRRRAKDVRAKVKASGAPLKERAVLRATHAKKITGANAKFVRHISRTNPGVAATAAGVGLAGVGASMAVGGRAKARNAERSVERLRRKRGKPYGPSGG